MKKITRKKNSSRLSFKKKKIYQNPGLIFRSYCYLTNKSKLVLKSCKLSTKGRTPKPEGGWERADNGGKQKKCFEERSILGSYCAIEIEHPKCGLKFNIQTSLFNPRLHTRIPF